MGNLHYYMMYLEKRTCFLCKQYNYIDTQSVDVYYSFIFSCHPFIYYVRFVCVVAPYYIIVQLYLSGPQRSWSVHCTYMLFTYEDGVLLMRQGASVVWHHSLLLMNGLNKSEAAVFSCRLSFMRAFSFISFFVVFVFHLFCLYMYI